MDYLPPKNEWQVRSVPTWPDFHAHYAIDGDFDRTGDNERIWHAALGTTPGQVRNT